MQATAPCLSGLPARPKGFSYAVAGFVQGTAIPALGEALATGPGAQRQWRDLSRALAGCRTATITVAGKKAEATIEPLAFPRTAGVSAAYAWDLTIDGVRIVADLLIFRAGGYEGYLTYSDLGQPAAPTGSTRPPTAAPSPA